MAFSINKVILVGNLGADPEIRTVGGGSRVAEFSLATSRRWSDRNGQLQEKTEWHRVIAWDSARGQKLAELAERYLKKGDQAYVEGEIQYRSYEAKDGGTRYVTEINAREIVLLGGRGGVGAGAGSSESGRLPRRQPQPTGGERGGSRGQPTEPDYGDFETQFPDGEGDDLPF